MLLSPVGSSLAAVVSAVYLGSGVGSKKVLPAGHFEMLNCFVYCCRTLCAEPLLGLPLLPPRRPRFVRVGPVRSSPRSLARRRCAKTKKIYSGGEPAGHLRVLHGGGGEAQGGRGRRRLGRGHLRDGSEPGRVLGALLRGGPVLRGWRQGHQGQVWAAAAAGVGRGALRERCQRVVGFQYLITHRLNSSQRDLSNVALFGRDTLPDRGIIGRALTRSWGCGLSFRHPGQNSAPFVVASSLAVARNAAVLLPSTHAPVTRLRAAHVPHVCIFPRKGGGDAGGIGCHGRVDGERDRPIFRQGARHLRRGGQAVGGACSG